MPKDRRSQKITILAISTLKSAKRARPSEKRKKIPDIIRWYRFRRTLRGENLSAVKTMKTWGKKEHQTVKT